MVGQWFAASGWRTLIADMDLAQRSALEWNSFRKENGISPPIEALSFNRVDEVLRLRGEYDLIVLDGAPGSIRKTLKIALAADLILLPTSASFFDLAPQVRLAHDFLKNGVTRASILFVAGRLGASYAEHRDMINYISEAGYRVVQRGLPEKSGFRQCLLEGLAPTECRFPTLRKKAQLVMREIADEITK